MRNFINSVNLSENWNTGELFQNLGSGSNWYALRDSEIAQACSTLNLTDPDAYGDLAYLLVHDNRPIMLARIDDQTGKVMKSALQGGSQPDAGWSRYTLALEKKLSGEDHLEETNIQTRVSELCEAVLEKAEETDDHLNSLHLRKAVLEARALIGEDISACHRAVTVLKNALKS